MTHRTVRTVRTAAAALALTTVFALAGCGDDDAGSPSAATRPDKLVVWLQPEAEKGWPDLLATVNKAFTSRTGVPVEVQTQQWDSHLAKLDTALTGRTPPDVVELGNTETTKYLAAGAFDDLGPHLGDFENSGTWVQGLKDSCTFDGKVMCVPYYGGSRAVIYNTELFAKAGITTPPTSLDELFADAATLEKTFGSDPAFSAFYLPGKNTKASLAFVIDAGGAIATQDGGTWKGALDSAEARSGLASFKSLVDRFSTADRTGDESKQDATFAKGKIAMMYGLSWEPGAIIDPASGGDPAMKGKIGVFPMPSRTPGKTMPVFLGGSDLAVPANSPNQELARQWIAEYTSTESMTAIAGTGLVPNTTSLLDRTPPEAKPFAEAAQQTFFVPVAPGWATVESKGVLDRLNVSILTGKATIDEATTTASTAITETLNESP
ncbi:extracellular solute-binding protein [Phycicoccus sonneratiae]|uniref:Extracellular solute-binding protein n=1 Tax=Phycicoccus sonneratiae TaxID=2807628 RepID=A0ABS2CJG5_9MICO|nr:extracellular solute-binding protein [Phycicoccus sonneraticus]MBM6400024.1 extracellular solute-binding protein [Phycicoccus sonneraticus]